MKSQVFTLETVLFFSLGVGMIIFLYLSYSSTSEYIKTEGYKLNLEKFGEYLSFVINKVYEVGNSTNSTVMLFLYFPPKIGECSYQIEERGGQIILSCPQKNIKRPVSLYGLDVKIKSKVMHLSRRGITITYSHGKVYLG